MANAGTRTVAMVMADTSALGRVAIRMAFESLPPSGEEFVAELAGMEFRLKVRECRTFPAAGAAEPSIILDCDQIGD